MKCIVCKSTEISNKIVEEEIKMQNDIFLLPIKVLVCNNCGERYYDRKTLKVLEETEQKLRDSKLDLENVGRIFRAKVA